MKIETRYECHARDAKTGKAQIYPPLTVADVHPDDAAELIRLQGARAYDGETLAEKAAKKTAGKTTTRRKPASEGPEKSKSTDDAARSGVAPAAAKKPAKAGEGEGLI